MFNIYGKNYKFYHNDRHIIEHQDKYIESSIPYCHEFYKSSSNILNDDIKKFNSWSLGVYSGLPVLHSADLRSFVKGHNGWGWDFQIPITKQLTHVFGLQFLSQVGQTTQFSTSSEARMPTHDYLIGRTKYIANSLLIDLNFTNMLRSCNAESYKWGIHGYFGPGLLYYKVNLTSFSGRKLFGTSLNKYEDVVSIFNGLDSLFCQGGLGLKYKINNNLETELKGMWIFTGDEKFDGSGTGHFSDSRMFVADIKPGTNDSLFTISMGLTYTFGDKADESLFWYNPMKYIHDILHSSPNKYSDINKNNLGKVDHVSKLLINTDNDELIDSNTPYPITSTSSYTYNSLNIITDLCNFSTIYYLEDPSIYKLSTPYNISNISYDKLLDVQQYLIIDHNINNLYLFNNNHSNYNNHNSNFINIENIINNNIIFISSDLKDNHCNLHHSTLVHKKRQPIHHLNKKNFRRAPVKKKHHIQHMKRVKNKRKKHQFC
jgi:OOP family OmpA-OmpF porin